MPSYDYFKEAEPRLPFFVPITSWHRRGIRAIYLSALFLIYIWNIVCLKRVMIDGGNINIS